MGEGNRVRWGYIAEVTPGTTPATPNFQIIRRTGGRLKSPLDFVKSREVRSDRNSPGVYETGRSADGNLEFEFSYGSFDAFLAALAYGTWTAPVSVTAVPAASVVAGTRTITVTAGFTDLVVGQWFKLGGSNQAANNTFWEIETRTSANEVVVKDPGGDLVDDGTFTASVKSGGMLRNGTTPTSFSLEQAQLDIDVYSIFRGMYLNKGTLEIAPGELITGSFDFMGLSAAVAASTYATGTTAANTNKVFNATSNIYALLEGGAAPADDLMGISLSFDNALRALKFVGSPFAGKINPADFMVSGTLNFYQNGKALIDKFLALTESSVRFRCQDALGQAVIITIPTFVYTGDGFPEVGGLGADTMLPMPFEAYYNSTHGCTLQVDRFVA